MAVERKHWSVLLTWTLRILVGCVFIFSGFVKAVDPWGTIYKTDAYLAAMQIDLWRGLQVAGVFVLCAVEFAVGVFLLLGCFRRSVAIMCGLMMAFMTPLTLWIAVSDPVSDCGCFGDAVVISNWATFWKNVVLSAAVAWLIVHNRRAHWIVTPALQWLAFIATGLFIVAIEVFGYVGQPVIDFRPYKTGETLVGEEDWAEGSAENFVFVYEKDGETKTFTETDSLPDASDGWVFVERRSVEPDTPYSVSKSTVSKSHDKALRLYDMEGEDDVTEEVLDENDTLLLVFISDLHQLSLSTSWKLNALHAWCRKNGAGMAAVVAAKPDEIEEWRDLFMTSYPVYTAEDTVIKEVVRGNPGIVFVRDGVIEWKNNLSAVDFDIDPNQAGDIRSIDTGADSGRLLRNSLWLYLSVMSVFVFLSFIPVLKRFYFPLQNKKGKGERAKGLDS